MLHILYYVSPAHFAVKFSCIKHDVRVLAFLNTFHRLLFIFIIIFKIKSFYFINIFSIISVSEMMAIFELTSCFSFHFFFCFFQCFIFNNFVYFFWVFFYNLMLYTNNKTRQNKTRKTNNKNTLYSLNVSKQTIHYVAQIFYLCCKAYLWVESVFILEWKVGNNNKQIHRTEESCTARGC